jgi:hypothetical protein
LRSVQIKFERDGKRRGENSTAPLLERALMN